MFHVKYYTRVCRNRRQPVIFHQRVVAEYGNDDGTKTSKSTGTAAGKLLKYQVQLGKILGAREAEKSD